MGNFKSFTAKKLQTSPSLFIDVCYYTTKTWFEIFFMKYIPGGMKGGDRNLQLTSFVVNKINHSRCGSAGGGSKCSELQSVTTRTHSRKTNFKQIYLWDLAQVLRMIYIISNITVIFNTLKKVDTIKVPLRNGGRPKFFVAHAVIRLSSADLSAVIDSASEECQQRCDVNVDPRNDLI